MNRVGIFFFIVLDDSWLYHRYKVFIDSMRVSRYFTLLIQLDIWDPHYLFSTRRPQLDTIVLQDPFSAGMYSITY